MADLTFYEFFAGGGMARLGLGRRWKCLFANDFDETKAATYRSNFPDANELHVADIWDVTAADLPNHADLAWASFPCQDLSLAGSGAGLIGKHSGTFWPFWRLMKELSREGRAPYVIVLENVSGALTSHKGRDFSSICRDLSSGGYRVGALVLDAVYFVPQSRPRVFVVATRDDLAIPEQLQLADPDDLWHTNAVVEAYERLPKSLRDNWSWRQVPAPAGRRTNFSALIEDEPTGVSWHSSEETEYLLSLMSKVNLAKVEAARALGRRVVGTVYRRTRPNDSGQKLQRAEVRFDDVAGCLRTPAGGSSRQTILVVEGSTIRSRLLSAREAARLMGLPDTYVLPSKYNAAYHVAGDGVVVPVVSHLSTALLTPLVEASRAVAVGGAA